MTLFHESPLSSWSLLGLLERLASRFTVLALDTPGYGRSDPISLEEPEIEDYADALAETLDALGIHRTGVFGTHTGASIALEFALRHPARVTTAVLDGLPLFSEEERVDLLANYLPRWPPEITGGHLLALWTRYRDQHLFFPWYRHDSAARLDMDMPDPTHLHEGVLQFLQSGDNYPQAYAAAFRHRTADALLRASGPISIIARENDLLAPHLERLPPGSHGMLVSGEPDRWAAVVGDLLAAHPGQREAPKPGPPRSLPHLRPTRQYIRVGAGQLLVRKIDQCARRPLVLLHAAGASGALLVPLMQRLASSRPVIALDMPGHGGSDPAAATSERSAPAIADYADTLIEALDELGLNKIDLYGLHTGACVALEAAIRSGDHVHRLITEGIPMWDRPRAEELLKDATPPLEPRWDGSHLVTAWAFLRDRTLFWPWYERTRGAIRHTKRADAPSLHAELVELLEAGGSYACSFRATVLYEPRDRLPRLKSETLVCTRPDDALHQFTAAAAALAPRAQASQLPPSMHERVALFEDFLDNGMSRQ